jgi:hypothetical protein
VIRDILGYSAEFRNAEICILKVNFVCVCVCVCMCVCVRERERKSDRESERKRGKESERERGLRILSVSTTVARRMVMSLMTND